ncbi:MAG: SH3 domain-containing protein [Phototrophicaceae bacterium]|jgi:hypothetical protein
MKPFTRNLFVLSLACLLLLTSSLFAFAQEGIGISDNCRNVDGQADTVVRIGVAQGTTAGGVYCRVIHNGSTFVLSAATIGDLGVIRRGVKAAVEVFAFGGTGASGQNFGQEVQICLRGTGTIIFLNAATTPRLVSEMPAGTRTLEGGASYTCTFISSSGTAVLVDGPAAPPFSDVPVAAPVMNAEGTVVAPSATTSTTTTSTGAAIIPLSGCRVTTTAQVRLREQPNTNSAVVARLPFEFSLQATGRSGDWVQVIYQTGQGWITSRYLNESAGCSN